MFCPFKQHYKCEGHFANVWKDIGHFFPNFSNGNIFCPLNCFLAMWPHHMVRSEIFLTNWRSFDLENFNLADCLLNIWDSLTIPTCKVGDYLKSFRIFSFWFSHTFTSYKNMFTFFCTHSTFWSLAQIDLGTWKSSFSFHPKDILLTILGVDYIHIQIEVVTK